MTTSRPTPPNQPRRPGEYSRERIKRPDTDLFEELIRLRDEQRAEQQEAVWLVKGKDMPWELNRHGKMQWYLHPAIEGVALKTMLFYKQEIPPGSSSGRQKCQGGMIFYVLEGRGYTILNGARHQWKAGDIINLPLFEEGCTYQHFNADEAAPVVMVGCYANHFDAIGVDMGSGFEELEPAPEYRQQHQP